MVLPANQECGKMEESHHVNFVSSKTTDQESTPSVIGIRAKRASIVDSIDTSLHCFSDDTSMSPDKADVHGVTSLMIACRENRMEIVVNLLNRGANIDAIDDRGFTPLFYAVRDGNIDISRYLLKRGATYATTINGGFSILMYAAMNGDCEHISLLYPYISIDNVDEDNMTPLMYCAYYKHSEAMSLLLSLHANPYIVSKDGKNALFICIEEGFEEGVHLLNQFGVSLNTLGTITQHGSIYCACSFKYRSIARYLLTEQTNIASFIDNLCMSPDHIAQSIVEVGLHDLYSSMSPSRQQYIQTVFFNHSRKYGDILLSFINSKSRPPIPCSNVADIFIYCLKISKMLSDSFHQIHSCDTIWKSIEHTLNLLDSACIHCTNPDIVVKPSLLTRILFTLLEGYCLCYSTTMDASSSAQTQSLPGPVGIVKSKERSFTDRRMVHFLLHYKALLILMNNNDPNVYHKLTYYPQAMSTLETIKSV